MEPLRILRQVTEEIDRMPASMVVLVALLGLAVGSFLNVVIFRVPLRQSVVSPRSRCVACGVQILDRDNIPLLSWLVLRGRCRNCHSPISKRYPLVELATGLLFAATAVRTGFTWDLPAFLVLLASLLALAIIDFEHLMLPKRIVYPSTIMTAVLFLLAAAATDEWSRLLVAALCGVGWFAIFWVINAVSPRAMGFGDVRLAPLLGLGLGWLGLRYVILGFFSANLIGAVVGLLLIATNRMKRDQQIPYAVFLALGTALTVFAGTEILAPIQRFL